MAPDDANPAVRRAWIVIFLLLVLGLGAAAVLAVGGQLVAGTVHVPVAV